mgnify:CR=1 FL=1
MKKDSGLYKKIKIYCYIVGLIAFLTALIVGVFLLHNLEKDEKTTGKYMAQITEKRVRARLDQYIILSNLLGNYISAGENLDENTFSELAEKIPNEDGVIKAFELAPEGIVTDIYPKQGNEGAFGLDVLREHEQKKDAILARDSGKYTLGGPYQLKQGGTGALLFNPVYQDNNSDKGEFWGFVILVIDWDRFIGEINLDYLSDADFCYRIWTYDRGSSDKIILAESQDNMSDNILTVECTVPNNTWYFDIIHSRGWIPRFYQIMCIVISCIFSLLIATVFYLISSKKHRERQYEAELEKSAEQAKNANEAKTRFLFNMSHDIRTPMNAIIGYAELMERHWGDNELTTNYLHKLKGASQFLLALIGNVLEIARIESGKETLNEAPWNLKKINDTLEIVLDREILNKQLHVARNIEIQHADVYCDSLKIQEIIMNLVSNAIKYTPDGGKIDVDIEEMEAVGEDSIILRICVSDTGIGISQKYIPHIFEAFTREKNSSESGIMGTGLGLRIVKSFVDLMDGSVIVQSEPGKGSSFIVEIPCRIVSEEKRIDQAEQSLPENPLKYKRILLVEDNELNMEIARTILQDAKAEVEVAADGAIAVAMVQKASAGYYDVVLMDIQMPKMNGYQATKAIRKLPDERAQVPIIAMTANAFEEDRQAAFVAGMDDYLAKPIEIDKLLRKIVKVLEKK